MCIAFPFPCAFSSAGSADGDPQTLIISTRKVLRGRGRISPEGGAMHDSQRMSSQIRQLGDARSGRRTMARKREQILHRKSRPDNIRFGDGWTIADVGEGIAAKQRSAGFLEDHPGIPAMWHVRRVEVADPLAANVENLTI